MCLCFHIRRHPLGNLTLHFLGENLKKINKLFIFPYIYLMLKDHPNPHGVSRYKRNLTIFFFFFNSLSIYNNWCTKTNTY